jgi:amylosucrase
MFKPKSAALLREIIRDKEVSEQVDQNFALRLSANFNHIKGLVDFLYGSSHQSKIVLKRLVNSMALSFKERSQELRALDLQRVSNEQWFTDQKWVGMMLYTDRFSGDIKSLHERIGFFEELGVNLVHLMPLLQCPEENNDGGYAVSDFRKVQPSLGDMGEIAALSREFRNREMLMMLDIAINHTSDEHEWAKKALAGDQKYQDYYYMFDDRDIPDAYEQSLPEVFPDTAPGNFTYQDEIDKWVMTVFHDYQWDLNFTNPVVFCEML